MKLSELGEWDRVPAFYNTSTSTHHLAGLHSWGVGPACDDTYRMGSVYPVLTSLIKCPRCQAYEPLPLDSI